MEKNPHLDDVARAVADAQDALARRDEAMAAARADGSTWRSIALAAGMTEHGVRYALKQAEARQDDA